MKFLKKSKLGIFLGLKKISLTPTQKSNFENRITVKLLKDKPRPNEVAKRKNYEGEPLINCISSNLSTFLSQKKLGNEKSKRLLFESDSFTQFYQSLIRLILACFLKVGIKKLSCQIFPKEIMNQ